MSIISSLAAFALRHTFNLSADTLLEWLGDRFADHSQVLPKALDRANDRAWQAVGLALAGDGLFGKVKDLFRGRDLTALRDQIRDYLAATPTGLEMSPAGLRAKACGELTHLRKRGRLAASLDRSAIARDLSRFGNTGRIAGEAAEAVGSVADSLALDAPHLAEVLRLTPSGGSPLLVTAFLFFLRREVETNDSLASGLTFDSLRHLTTAQDRGLTFLDNRTEGILDQIGLLFDALDDWFATADGKLDDLRAKLDKLLADRHVSTGTAEPLRVTVTNEKERDLLRVWRDELRKLPPELLEAADWSKLGDALAAGRLFAEAREAHQAAAANASDAKDKAAEAEAEFKAYRDACEEEKWDDALAGLKRAAGLDPVRFAPFPLRRYEPIAILGSGGFGTVIRCRERLARGREVAVKAFHAEDLGREVDEVFAEAHTLSELVAPGIVKVIHWDYAEPPAARPFLVMEYFPGVSLAVHLKQYGRLPVHDVVGIARGVAEGMTAAHGAGVIHRDLKPGNVLIRPNGPGRWEVRVIDFGLAVRFSTVQASASTSLPHRIRRDHSFAGTLEYASPEQKGVVLAPIGPRSDVYSFGKTMLEALLGTTEPTTRSWKQVPDEYREPVRDLFERCVEKHPEDRFAGFGPVAEALTALDSAGWERSETSRNLQVEVGKAVYAPQADADLQRAAEEAERQRLAEANELKRQEEYERKRAEDKVTAESHVAATVEQREQEDAIQEAVRRWLDLSTQRKKQRVDVLLKELEADEEQNTREADDEDRRQERQRLDAEWKITEVESGRRLRQRLNAEWKLREAMSKKEERQRLAAECRKDAIAYYNIGEYDNSILKFDESIQIDAKWSLAYYHRGLAKLKMEDFKEAIEDFDEVIRLDPEWALPYYKRGQIWLCRENYDQAIRDFDEAIRLDPTNTKARDFRGQAWLDRLYIRGQAWMDEEEYDLAIQTFDEVIKLDPKNSQAFCFRGQAWTEKKEYELAISDFDQAICLNPEWVDPHYNRGKAWRFRQDYDQAILHAARSETFSNFWNSRVMSDSIAFAWVVGTPSRTSWTAAWKSANFG